MSIQASLSDALATAPLVRERRPAVPDQAGAPERRDNAWQREMERAQAGAWFPGALPEDKGLSGNRPALQAVRPASLPAPRPATAQAVHPVHAPQVSRPDSVPRRGDEQEDRIETKANDAGLQRDQRALNGPLAHATSQSEVRASDDVPLPTREGGQPAGTAAAGSVASGAGGLSAFEAGAGAASVKMAAAPVASPAAAVALGQPGPAMRAALPSPSTAVQGAVPASAALSSVHGADPAAPSSHAPAASPAQPAGQAPRAAAALPAAPAGSFAAAASVPATAEGGTPMAQEGSGLSGAASGIRSLASIERLLGATLGGSPGPRLHLNWDGQAVAVWLGVDGTVDPTALLRTVQSVLHQQGLQLSSLICNGRTIVLPRPAQGQGRQSNSEHQEN